MKAISIVLFVLCALHFFTVGAVENKSEAHEETADVLDSIIKDGDSSAEDLQEAAKRIKNELRFSLLRKERTDLQGDIPRVKAELDALVAKESGIRTEIEKLEEEISWSSSIGRSEVRDTLQKQMEDYAKRRTELEKKKANVSEVDRRQVDEELLELDESSAFIQSQLADEDQRNAYAADQGKRAEARAAQLKTQLPDIQDRKFVFESKYAELLELLFLVEDQVNVLLIPETARNKFKFTITAAFSSLVALVIVGFFYIAHKDEVVRRSIFSSQSGIQFLTLFSLVIAIILFGITNILGGKELSALLGGISGYILGRVTDSKSSLPTGGNANGGSTGEAKQKVGG